MRSISAWTRAPGEPCAPSTISSFMTAEYSTAEFRARFADQARRAAEMSDVIIAVSRFTADHVMELLGVPAERIRVNTHHGVHIPEEATEAPREKLVSVRRRDSKAEKRRAAGEGV